MKSYAVWDRTTRVFHWVNVLLVFILIILGTVILNGKVFGLAGDGKVMMKTVHVYTGYLFALNLGWRLVWGFIGGAHARWAAVLPLGKGYVASLKAFVASLKTDKPVPYAGHNPLGRLSVTLLLLLLLTQAVTGLVIAGTDIYAPPFGGMIAEWVAASGLDPATLVPGDKSMVDPDAWKEMRAFRSPFITVHIWGYYILMGVVALHIGAVIHGEVKHGGALVSAMFTGKKLMKDKPVDIDEKQ